MIINDIRQKSKREAVRKAAFICGISVLVVLGIIGSIKLVHTEERKIPVTIEYGQTQTSVQPGNFDASGLKETVPEKTIHITPEKTTSTTVSPNGSQSGMMYEGSRGGRTYYPAGCSAAKRISAKNKIWFESIEEAERLGYTLSKLCKDKN